MRVGSGEWGEGGEERWYDWSKTGRAEPAAGASTTAELICLQTEISKLAIEQSSIRLETNASWQSWPKKQRRESNHKNNNNNNKQMRNGGQVNRCCSGSSGGDGAEAKHGSYRLIKSFSTSIRPMSASSCTQSRSLSQLS